MHTVTVVHTKRFEDLPSRTGIWKDFTEAVSLHPDLNLAKGLGKKEEHSLQKPVWAHKNANMMLM